MVWLDYQMEEWKHNREFTLGKVAGLAARYGRPLRPARKGKPPPRGDAAVLLCGLASVAACPVCASHRQ